MDNSKYKSSYSETGLWDKIKKYGKKAGKDVVLNALKLYYPIAMKKASPAQIAAITAALGYFICPIDAIPDLTPLIGYTDDAGVLTAAVTTLACCSNPEVLAAAKKKVNELFG